MFTNFDDLRDFALTFVDKLVEEKFIESDIDSDNETEFDIQDMLIEHLIDKIKQDDCLIPGGSQSHCVTDINEDYMIAFIDSDAIPLGVFTIFVDRDMLDDDGEPKHYVSINNTVVYLYE